MKAFAQNVESRLNILAQILKEEMVGAVMIVDISLGLHIKDLFINQQNQGTMTDKELIKQEIERRKSLADKQKNNGYFFARSDAYMELLNFIDSMTEEPASDDLREEVHKHLLNIGATIEMYSGNVMGLDLCEEEYVDFARHFAKWQKRQMIKNAVEAEVMYPASSSTLQIRYKLPKNTKLKYGDKVKIIIVKED